MTSQDRNLDLIIGCVANAHLTTWTSTDITTRGEALLEFIANTQVDIANRAKEPAFITAVRREVLIEPTR